MKLRITVEGKAYDVEVEFLDSGSGSLVRPMSTPPAIAQAAATPAPVAVSAPKATSAPASSAGGKSSFLSPIAGVVFEVNVSDGQSVAKGDQLFILEAMKMETALVAPYAGTIRAVLVKKGDAVRANQPLMEYVT